MPIGEDLGPFENVVTEVDEEIVDWLGGYSKLDAIGAPVYGSSERIVFAREHNRIVGAIADLVAAVRALEEGGGGTVEEVVGSDGVTIAGTAEMPVVEVTLADASLAKSPSGLQVGVLATDAQHGTRGGGTQHAAATGEDAGFMSAADKTKLDGLPSSAVAPTRAVNSGAGLTGGGDLTGDRTLAVGAHADGSIVVNADDVQVGVLASDAQHGTRGGGTQHAAATSSVAGFMSANDKAKIDRLRDVYNLVTDFGLSTTNSAVARAANRVAIQAALDACKTVNKPIYLPAGTYRVDFSRAYDELNATLALEGRLRIDAPNVKIFGDGIGRSVLITQSTKTSLARFASLTNDTTATGQRNGALVGNAVPLQAGQAAQFVAGQEIYVAQNADGTNPRTMTGVVTVDSIDTFNNRIGLNNAGLIDEFTSGDYIFVKNRMALQTPADSANFSAANGLSARCEVYASVNADGSSPKAARCGVLTIVDNVLTLGCRADTEAGDWVAGDYLFANFSYEAFEHRPAGDGGNAATTPYNFTMEDIEVSAEYYPSGNPEAPDIPGFNAAGTATPLAYVYRANSNNAGGGTTTEYTVEFNRCKFSGGWSAIEITGNISETVNSVEKFTDCDISGGRVGVYLGGARTRRAYFTRCNIHDTDPDEGSHLVYIGVCRSYRFETCRFDGTRKWGIHNWGSGGTGRPFMAQIVGCTFGEGILAAGILTPEAGPVTIDECRFECATGIQWRNSVTITSCIFRPVSAGTCVTNYSDTAYSAQALIKGCFFDWSRVAALGAATTCIQLDQPGQLTVEACTFGSNAGQAAIEPVGGQSGGACIQINGSAYNASAPEASVKVSDCNAIFNQTTGTTNFLRILAEVNVECTNNRVRGRWTSAAILAPAGVTTNPTPVTMAFVDNRISSYSGGGIRVLHTVGAAHRFVFEGNRIVTRSSSAHGIGVEFAGGAFSPTFKIIGNTLEVNSSTFRPNAIIVNPTTATPTGEISENDLSANGASIYINAVAGEVYGHDNVIRAGRLRIPISARATLRTRNATQGASVASAASIALSANHNAFTITGNTLIDQIDRVGGDRACDGDEIVLYLQDANAEFGSDGNIVAAAGARSAGTFVRLRYVAGIDTATVSLGRVSSFTAPASAGTPMRLFLVADTTADFRIGMLLKVDDASDASSPRAQVASLYVAALQGGGTPYVEVGAWMNASGLDEIPVTGLANNDYLFLGGGRWVEVTA